MARMEWYRMSINYIDKYGLYNVKPVKNGEPSGNDGLIISAYADNIGLHVDHTQIIYFVSDLKTKNTLPVERLPGKETPYPSRDFFLGAGYFGAITGGELVRRNWKFSPFELPKFNLFKFMAQVALCIGKDRNFYWMNKLDQIYFLAFSVPVQDRAFHYRISGYRNIPIFYRIVEMVDKYLIPSGNSSSKLIRWLKYGKYPGIECFIEYFGVNHPITIAARTRYENR
jgi:hypothetical protein